MNSMSLGGGSDAQLNAMASAQAAVAGGALENLTVGGTFQLGTHARIVVTALGYKTEILEAGEWVEANRIEASA